MASLGSVRSDVTIFVSIWNVDKDIEDTCMEGNQVCVWPKNDLLNTKFLKN